jgi:hypothetical protein
MQKPRIQTFLSIFLIVLMVIVAIFTLTTVPSVHATGTTTVNYSTGAASYIQNLVNNVTANGGWLQSIQTCYDGIALGQTTISQLQTLVDGLNGNSTVNWQQIFYWYYVMQKFQVTINQTTIKAALDAAPMLQNGLPFTDSTSGSPDFLVYDRYLVSAYTLALALNYSTAKWNITTAYNSFKTAIINRGTPALWVSNTTVASGISYGPRYYDESAETIDMFLQFWKAGIPDGMIQAEYWWNWTNSHLWNTVSYSGGSFYQYALSWTAFECEAGGMNSIMWQLYYYNSMTPNINNLITDMQTRWLSNLWNSPQWSNYVTVHAGLGVNSQTRLKNTIMSWAAMLGLYANMTNTMQSEVQELLNGSTPAGAPAWELLEQSNLYNSGLFSMTSNTGASGEATADAASLMMYLATIPVTGSIAVPLADVQYEDINNIIDGEISNINLTSNQLTISVMNPGNFSFTFGTSPITYTLPSSGIWQLTFSSDWNTIINAVLMSQLSKTRIYFGTTSTPPSPQPTTFWLTINAIDQNNNSVPTNVYIDENLAGSAGSSFQITEGNHSVSGDSWVWDCKNPPNCWSSNDSEQVDVSSNTTITLSYHYDVARAPTPSPTTSPPTPTPTPTPPPTPTPTSNPTPSPSPSPSTSPSPSVTSQNTTPSPSFNSSLSPSPSIPEFPAVVAISAITVTMLIAAVFLKKASVLKQARERMVSATQSFTLLLKSGIFCSIKLPQKKKATLVNMESSLSMRDPKS